MRNCFKKHVNFALILLVLLLLFIFLISFKMGRYSIKISDVLYAFYTSLMGHPNSISTTMSTVIFNIRLPRILAALLIGASLALAGVTYQGLFRNPMASSDILGASAGASFGAAVALLLSLNLFAVQISAFIFGMLAVIIVFFISRFISHNNNMILILVLIGLVVSSLFQSFVSIIKYVADPDSKLPAITFWLMGGLSNITFKNIVMILPAFIIGTVPIFMLRWRLNALTFGEEEAKALGVNVEKIRIILIFCSTILTTSSVAIGGIIGWVGLVIPHVARILVGSNYKKLVPCSILLGASYLLLIDDLARSMFSMEIPIGILTSLIGAPFFIIILLKRKDKFI
ncbi:putative ABC transporter permease protein [Clostridium felsineum DSM 794]|nr:putative ABC transporter permease protein [Clostridium felsineum DSM 794]